MLGVYKETSDELIVPIRIRLKYAERDGYDRVSKSVPPPIGHVWEFNLNVFAENAHVKSEVVKIQVLKETMLKYEEPFYWPKDE